MTPTTRTVLVTGGAGFIGSHVVEHLLEAGHRVVNLDLLTYAGNLDNLADIADHERYSFVHGDICDRRLITKVMSEYHPSVLFNIAAESHVDRSIDDASAFIETNVTGVFRLLEGALAHWRRLDSDCKAAFRFIQMSTDEVYGSIAQGAFTEDSNYAPNSPYAASKAAGDHMARAYGITYGLPVIVVHASNTYGPRQYPEKLIPHMIISALEGRELPVYGQGENVRDWMHVDDLARGLLCVVTSGQSGRVYNFAGRDECRNIDTVRRLCNHLDRLAPAAHPHETKVRFVADRPGHDLRYAMDIEKVARAFGWKPEVAFAHGLPATIAWYLEHKAWWQTILARGYRGRRVGLGA